MKLSPTSKIVAAPVLVFLVLSLTSTTSWLAVRTHRQDQMKLETELVARQLQQRLQTWFATRVAMVEQLALYWPTQFEENIDQFREKVLQLLEAFDGFQAINFVNTDGVIELVVPLTGNEKALGMDLHQSPYDSVRTALRAGLSGSIARTDATIQLLQGGRGYASYFPVYSTDGKVAGLLNGVFRIDDAMETFLQDEALRGRFRLLLRETSGSIAFNSDAHDQHWPYMMGNNVLIIDRPLRLSVAPSPEFLESQFDSLPNAILLASLCVYLLLAIVLAGFLRKSAAYQQQDAERRAIEHERARIASIIDVATDFVAMLDAELRVVYMNQAGRRMLGISANEDIAAITATDFHAMGFVELLHQQALPEAMRNGYWRGEIDFIARNKTLVPVSQTIVHHKNESGDPAGFSTIARDISSQRAAELQRQALEGQLLHAQKLESLGILAGGIAHDFNNILMGIMGSVSLARRVQDQTSLARHLDTIDNSSHRAAEICSQMLAYSGRAHSKMEPLDLLPLLTEIVELLRASIPKTHEIKIHAAADVSPVNADSSQLSQVILNIIKNASDAMEGHSGRIDVVLRQQEFASGELMGFTLDEQLPAAIYLLLEVHDPGCGMEADTLLRIFDPFFTTDAPGRGLGLAAVLGIIRSHNGGICVESEPGKGTSFRVALPITTDPVAVEPDFRPDDLNDPMTDGEGELILLVEDEATIRDHVESALASSGYSVITASNGEQGWATYKEYCKDICVVVLDISMPKLGGVDVLARIRADDSCIPVIMTSGYAAELNRSHEFEQAYTSFLHKPYQVSELKALVRSAEKTPLGG